MGMFFHKEFFPHQQNGMRVLTSDRNLHLVIGKVCTGVELGHCQAVGGRSESPLSTKARSSLRQVSHSTGVLFNGLYLGGFLVLG